MVKKIFSGVQPTGNLHLGNYIGAIKNFIDLQNQDGNECVYCVVDLHAITFKQDPKTLKILEKSPSYTDYLEPDHLSILNNLLDDFGKSNITIDPKLVRGLDYYTGFIFEVTSKELGSQDSFIGGGRYDGLFSSLGGKDIHAIGFAIGLE